VLWAPSISSVEVLFVLVDTLTPTLSQGPCGIISWGLLLDGDDPIFPAFLFLSLGGGLGTLLGLLAPQHVLGHVVEQPKGIPVIVP
jgi:hypothetical protein